MDQPRNLRFLQVLRIARLDLTNIERRENIRIVDANFTSHVEMEAVWPDASPYGFLGDDIGMTCYCSGAIGILKAIRFQHKQFFYDKCEHLLGAWSETDLIWLLPPCAATCSSDLLVICVQDLLQCHTRIVLECWSLRTWWLRQVSGSVWSSLTRTFAKERDEKRRSGW